MTVTVSNNGGQVVFGGAGVEDVQTQSTATAAQELVLTTPVSNVGMGTATGQNNVYNLAEGVVGAMKFVQATATGEAKLILNGGTATGRLIFSTAASSGIFIMRATGWHVVDSDTLTTATF